MLISRSAHPRIILFKTFHPMALFLFLLPFLSSVDCPGGCYLQLKLAKNNDNAYRQMVGRATFPEENE